MTEISFTTQSELLHHGIKGQSWGVRNGPPYPLDRPKPIHSREQYKRLKENEKNKKHRDNQALQNYWDKKIDAKANYQKKNVELNLKKTEHPKKIKERSKYEKDIRKQENENQILYHNLKKELKRAYKQDLITNKEKYRLENEIVNRLHDKHLSDKDILRIQLAEQQLLYLENNS